MCSRPPCLLRPHLRSWETPTCNAGMSFSLKPFVPRTQSHKQGRSQRVPGGVRSLVAPITAAPMPATLGAPRSPWWQHSSCVMWPQGLEPPGRAPQPQSRPLAQEGQRPALQAGVAHSLSESQFPRPPDGPANCFLGSLRSRQSVQRCRGSEAPRAQAPRHPGGAGGVGPWDWQEDCTDRGLPPGPSATGGEAGAPWVAKASSVSSTAPPRGSPRHLPSSFPWECAHRLVEAYCGSSVTQLCPSLCDAMDYLHACQAPLSMGFSTQEYYSG